MKTDFDNNIPIYIQLVEQLTGYIISGRFSAGERLPSVRDLAMQLKVNPNTVQKTFVELENMGLIFTERTNGKFVTNDKQLIEKHKKEYADKLTRKYIESMENIGFSEEEIVSNINNLGGSR